MKRLPPKPTRTDTLLPTTTLFRSSGSTAERDHHPVRAAVVAQRYQVGFDFQCAAVELAGGDAPAGAVRIGDLDHVAAAAVAILDREPRPVADRKSTRLNSSH